MVFTSKKVDFPWQFASFREAKPTFSAASFLRQESYLNRPLSCAVDVAGDLIFADFNHRLRTAPVFTREVYPSFLKVYLFGFCFNDI